MITQIPYINFHYFLRFDNVKQEFVKQPIKEKNNFTRRQSFLIPGSAFKQIIIKSYMQLGASSLILNFNLMLSAFCFNSDKVGKHPPNISARVIPKLYISALREIR